ncbi:MAG TPA: hypothetical protein VGE74_11880, partial [Gemmata sp.]
MTENEEPSLQTHWRVDALVITLLVVGTLLAVAVGTAHGLRAGPNVFGSWGDRAAGVLLEPLGWAALVMLAGWFAIAALLVVHRGPVRLAVRAFGWACATAVAAVGLDWFGRGLVAPSVAGRGGSVGAYLRFGLEDATEPTWALILFGLSVVLSVLLVGDRFVALLGRVSWVALGTVWGAGVWVNDRVADGMEAVLVCLGRWAKVGALRATGLAKGALAA